MKDLKIKYTAATNFMCFKDKVEFFLEDYGNIVLISGKNYDVVKNGKPSSNGSGKSSCAEIMAYTFYGKPIKEPKSVTHDDIIHNWSKGKLETEVCFDDYKVVRNRRPNKLRVWHSKDHLWDDNTEVTLGTMPETQKLINDIVGLNYETFCNVVVFDDGSTEGFIESDARTKRIVVENLLGLDRYREFSEKAKELSKDKKKDIKDKAQDYEKALNDVDVQEKLIDNIKDKENKWEDDKKTELKNLILRVKQKQQKLEELDENKVIAEYNEAQDKIGKLEVNMPAWEGQRGQITQIIAEARPKLENLREVKNSLQLTMQGHKESVLSATSQIKKNQDLMESLGDLREGQECPTCHGMIKRNNYDNVLKHAKNIISAQGVLLNKEEKKIEEVKGDLEVTQGTISKLEQGLKEANAAFTSFEVKIETKRQELSKLSKIPKPEMSAEERILEDGISELKGQLKKRKDEIKESPYKEIIDEAVTKKKDLEKLVLDQKYKVKELEKDLPYLDFWVKAFGDKGIRKFIVDGIIPALNSKLAYLMQYLMEDQIKITFNNELEEVIEQKPADGNPFVYYLLSKGERQRIDLALSQAFAHIMMLNCGTCPSLVFLDEVTGGAIDQNGVQGMYNMILELAKERQVFITTHDVHLLEMLQGCEEIMLRKEDGATVSEL